ncbi:hypothetical protein PVAP13_8KG348515 [Panicum virgatum]|uniref:Uncharacterized protein n=1 Tax=Panicum virgatum TaxID=38727 RepID=A0A8T0PIT3_PANVG|nr:hypothetical protein PVAP13_8KG348515 [Panicum virgatum]
MWWRPSNPDLSRPLPASARRRARRWLPSFIKYLASTVLPSERPVAGTCVLIFSSTRGIESLAGVRRSLASAEPRG